MIPKVIFSLCMVSFLAIFPVVCIGAAKKQKSMQNISSYTKKIKEEIEIQHSNLQGTYTFKLQGLSFKPAVFELFFRGLAAPMKVTRNMGSSTITIKNRCLEKVRLTTFSERPIEVKIPDSIACKDLQNLTIVATINGVSKKVTLTVAHGYYAPEVPKQKTDFTYEATGKMKL